jgi:small GTP-binding protein
MQGRSRNPAFKLCIYGQEAVGKTAILNRRLRASFSDDYRPTIAAAFAAVGEEVDGQSVVLKIWDTAGQEKYQEMMPLYFRDVSAVILVADVSAPSSWAFIQKWIEVEFPGMKPVPMLFICLNKCDLPENEKLPQFMEWVTSQEFPVLKTSAQSGHNVMELFQQLATKLVDADAVRPQAITQQLGGKGDEGDRCC